MNHGNILYLARHRTLCINSICVPISFYVRVVLFCECLEQCDYFVFAENTHTMYISNEINYVFPPDYELWLYVPDC